MLVGLEYADKSPSVTISISKYYFPMDKILNLTIEIKMVLTFESVDEILKCDHSNESYCAMLSCGAVCCTR